MSIVIVQNNLEIDGPVAAPVHDDGKGYRYCMYFNSDIDVAFADTYEELLDVMIPGYSEMSEEDQVFHRIKLAQTAAAQTQAMILASLEDNEVTDEEYQVLSAHRGLPQLRADWWTSEVPLVIVETSYQPFTDVPRPASALSATADAPNLWWVRPVEEEDFLISLHEIGFVRLMENIDLSEI